LIKISLSSRNKNPVADSHKITHITILNALMTAWVGDLFGVGAIIRGPTNTTTDKGVFSCPRGPSRTQNLFQNEKSVLPGNVDLKHETAF
jgi:hypothetical protein